MNYRIFYLNFGCARKVDGAVYYFTATKQLFIILFFIIDRYKELPQKILAWVKFLKFQSFKLSCPHDPCAVRMRPA